jgi:hypothetical protein
MIDPAPRRDSPRLQVTASTLVRHFGEWQEHAARAPVYVLHHGRPRLILVGVELAATLGDAGRSDQPAAALLDSTLDALDLPLLLLDGEGVIARRAPASSRYHSATAAHSRQRCGACSTVPRANEFWSRRIARRGVH